MKQTGRRLVRWIDDSTCTLSVGCATAQLNFVFLIERTSSLHLRIIFETMVYNAMLDDRLDLSIEKTAQRS